MIIDLKEYLFNTIGNQLLVSHLNDKVKFEIVEADKVGQKFKDAVKESKNGTFLNDAEYVIRFAEPIETPVEDEEEKKEEEKKEEEKKVEKEENQEEQDTEETTEDGEKDVLSESVKVEDLTNKEPDVKEPEVKSMTTPCDCGEKIVGEADTTATGQDLRQKVRKTLERVFFIDSTDTENQVELIDLPDFIEGYNIYFCKLSFKNS